jgi:hypothetical protein
MEAMAKFRAFLLGTVNTREAPQSRSPTIRADGHWSGRWGLRQAIRIDLLPKVTLVAFVE